MSTSYRLFAANHGVRGIRSAPRPFKAVEPGFLPDFGSHELPARGLPAPPATEPDHSMLRVLHASRERPGCGKVPVQGELSLAGVRVVRNDLSDADLEVIHAPAAFVLRASARRACAGADLSWWQRWVGHWFSVGLRVKAG
jgi:hypothetical protein